MEVIKKGGDSMKKLVYPVMFVLLSTFAFAQTGLMHYSGEKAGINLMAFVYFAVMAFIFSVIFWLTHNWLVKKKR